MRRSTYLTLVGVSRQHGLHKGKKVPRLAKLLNLLAEKAEEWAHLLPRKIKPKWNLTADQVRLIRVSQDKHLSLAAEYRVDPATISRVKSGKAYKWVE